MKELISWYENLSPESLDEIEKYYAGNCYFRDPFNEIRSANEIKKIYEKMFRHLVNPKFKITHSFKDGKVASLYWEFDFVLFKREFNIKGNTFLKFNSENKIIEHIDYWDSVQEWWIKLPLLGAVLRLFF